MSVCVCIYIYMCTSAQPQVLCNRLQFTPMQVIWNICVVCMWHCAFKMEGILCLWVNTQITHIWTRAYNMIYPCVHKQPAVGLTHSLLLKFINLTAFESEPIFKHLIYSGGGEGSECIHMRMCGWGRDRDMSCIIKLHCVMFHGKRFEFEPHTCIVIEGFGSLERHLLTWATQKSVLHLFCQSQVDVQEKVCRYTTSIAAGVII